jgi:chemotaxis protein MotA
MARAAIWRTVTRTGTAGIAAGIATAVMLLMAVTGFLDVASLVITVGGALATAWMTFSREAVRKTWALVGEALAPPADPEPLIATVKALARAHRVGGPRQLEDAAAAVDDEFLRRAVTLALEADDEAELVDLLTGEARFRATHGDEARHVVTTLGKLFPAFGLIGTLIGLALLLRSLADPTIATIGPGLGVAVLTTLYGALLANVVVLPIATKLHAHLERESLRTEMIVEGVRLIRRREYPTRVERVLRAYVGPVDARPRAFAVRRHAAA